MIRSISGFKSPQAYTYWEEYRDEINKEKVTAYSQFSTYYKGNIVLYNGILYVCLVENEFKFKDIRIPMVDGWMESSYSDWQPVEDVLWEVTGLRIIIIR